MTQIQVGSAERRLAQWVLYAVLAAPIVATLLHDLGVGAVAPWIIYASIAVPMIAMLSDREIGVDPLLRWVLFASSITARCGSRSAVVQLAQRTRPWIALRCSGSLSGSWWCRPSNS